MFNKIYVRLFKNMSAFRHLLIWYLSAMFIASFILWLPISLQDGIKIDYIDSLFISTSALTDTGLSPLVISETFNFIGQSVLLILVQLGGIGWFALKIFFLSLFFKKILNKKLFEVEQEMGTTSKETTLSVVKIAVIVTVGSTILIGLVFGILFATIPNVGFEGAVDPGLLGNWGESIWTGVFHASTSINNAGLDIFSGDVSMGAYFGNIGIQVLTLILVVLGGIGFTVIYDVRQYFKNKYRGQNFRFSLMTKISVTSYLVITILGLGAAYTSEGINYINQNTESIIDSNLGEEGLIWWSVAFTTFSTRNAGLSTVDISLYSQATHWLFSSLMFIGSGPGSTAGGLRTTTIAMVYISIVSIIRNQDNETAFSKSIDKKTIRDSFVIFSLAVFLVFTSTLLIGVIESLTSPSSPVENSVLSIFFLVNSAFGTTGLMIGDLSIIHVGSKITLILIMIIGQLGILTSIKVFSPIKYKNKNKHKLDERFVHSPINLGH